MSVARRVLVATDAVADANLIRKLLREEFGDVMSSTDPDRAIQDFEKHRPEVLVLAFDSLEKAERYYLGLYRLGTVVHALAHRTVILCNKDDLQRVYTLCKKEYFDDYVLFWPLAHDAPRLPMAVHHALRQLSAHQPRGPTAGDFAAQARRVTAIEDRVELHTALGSARIDAASRSLQRAGQDIGSALDGFSHKMSRGDLSDMVEVKDALRLQREIDRLKADEIATSLRHVAASVQPVRDWADSFKEELAPHLESARAFQRLAEQVCPLVLMVDDDEFQHMVLQNLLQDENVELAFATSGTGALVALRKRRPDLILMDVDLPDVDGIEAARQIKSAPPFASVPVLMITGHSDKEVVERSVKAGATGFVVKPFSREVLLAKIRSVLMDPENGAPNDCGPAAP
jgi:CheY-like chemotaxis protein